MPYYPGSGGQTSSPGYGVNAALTYIAGATTTSTSGSYTYSPYYAMALDPAAGPGASAQPFDYAQARNPNEVTSAAASLTRRLGRRTSTSLAYAFNQSSLPNQHLSVRCQEARLSADRQLSRRLSLRGSYAYREGRFEAAAASATDRSHDFELGVGYSARVSLAAVPRRSTSVSEHRLLRRDTFTVRPGWRGSARVSRTFTPGWTAGVGVGRSLQFNAVLQTPVWADVANADLSGRFGQRLNLTLTAILLERPARDVARSRVSRSTPAGRARKSAWPRLRRSTLQYIYYRYDFPAGYELPAGVPLRMNRQRLQVGASFWLPILRAGRAARSAFCCKPVR